MATIKEIKKQLGKMEGRSKWQKGVLEYANELIDSLYWLDDKEELNARTLETALLNGANSWSEYSWGGCSLIYNVDICSRLSTPTQQKRTKNGQLNPNNKEQWLDTQARALRLAYNIILNIVMEAE